MEDTIMKIILHAGDARSKSLLALKSVKQGDFEKARCLLEEARQSSVAAHKVQTELIQKEVSGETQTMTLLLVHAQDHLMTALSIRDVVLELINYFEVIEHRLQKLEKEEGK
ncbi:PTS lactose/cellobiose transporter subunit IIA [Enterococcus rivorum]|uniref:PTS cellobiose transporter subunit IIA n=1 Tax=Enterococcus rivorum TaxID=762845 RepID=A0A1E5L1J1_9ENTE|nr:PTS lactose/cellobiose transporter subunit IIA [Enterococcus rivorum]MBP2097727.1 PTS system cellobiose-specific IIA component [Enterococcus rivorum]OEH83996.1 PTS cellobiose transporter subunit IIA [Enterococcus rivorum]